MKKNYFLHEFMCPPATHEHLDDVVRAFEKVFQFRFELNQPV